MDRFKKKKTSRQKGYFKSSRANVANINVLHIYNQREVHPQSFPLSSPFQQNHCLGFILEETYSLTTLMWYKAWTCKPSWNV